MYQVVDQRLYATVIAWIAIVLITFSGYFEIPRQAQLVVGFINLFLIIALSNPVWRRVWRWGPVGKWLSNHIFPDLNGTYEVVLESNWPVVQTMLDAARKEGARFDPFNLDQAPPALVKICLEATIEQKWSEICLRVYDPTSAAVIGSSRTLAVMPRKATLQRDKELLYIFEQSNERPGKTDGESFLGAARLTIDPTQPQLLKGEYWNNRMWRRGLNAAGKITLRRRSTKVNKQKL